MTPVETLRGAKVALFGLGGSGLSTLRALVAGGAEVSAWDDTEGARANAVAAGFAPVDLSRADWSGYKVLVLAPGVPLTHPKPHWTVEKVNASGVPVIGDIELFVRERAARAPKAPISCAMPVATSRLGGISARRSSTCRRPTTRACT